MLQNTLSALLQSVASRYAELSPSDVGIGLRGGRLVVDDVQLRADTFNGPHVPFHVHEGRAGRLRVNVPWSALTSAPVQVYLENVHLIAGPKHSYPDNAPAARNKRSASRRSTSSAQWHQTNVGRLLFNVSVEMYGLKVEYRDDHCVGIISIASLHAYSAGPDWQRRFVSLTSGLDPNSPYATAVTMRKLVRLGGVHWVMIPRTKQPPEQSHPQSESHHAEAQASSPRFEQRRMDLQSYESQAPILDGIPISVKVLLHSGTAQVDNQFSPALHAEIHVDIEDPSINLTARQIKWIDHIVKAGFGLHASNDRSRSAPSAVSPPKRRRPPPVSDGKHSSAPTSDAISEDGTDHSEAEGSVSASDDMSISSRLEKELAHQLQTSRSNSSQNSTKKLSGPYAEQSQQDGDNEGDDEDYEEDELIIVQDPNVSDDSEELSRRGGLSSFWQAIVSENVDDTVDDAAIALGLANGHTQEEEEDGDMIPEVEESVEPEHQFAREAVNAAAEAGGLTMKLVLRTPDHEAWEKVKKLEEELEEEKQVRTRLEDAERILKEFEQRIQDSEAMAQKLRDRNEALVKELQDLENMTSQAGKNKDAMIRQMEAALAKAERNLQAMLQAKFEKHANSAITKSIQVNTYYDENDELRPVSSVSEQNRGNQELSSAGSVSIRPRNEDSDKKEQHKSEDEQKSEERSEPSTHKILDAVHEPAEEKKQVPLSSELQGNERAATSSLTPRQAGMVAPPTVPDDTGIDSSNSAPAGVQEPGLQEIKLHNDRYRQLSMDAPSVSITKLIADMSTKVDVANSSRNKHLEAAMSSEGLTLI